MNKYRFFLIAILLFIGNLLYAQSEITPDEIYSFTAHRKSITDIAFNKDSSIMATASGSQIIIWKLSPLLKRPSKIEEFNDIEPINAIAFSYGDQYLVSGGESQELILWDFNTGEEKKRFKVRYTESELKKIRGKKKSNIQKRQWRKSSSKEKYAFKKDEIGSYPSTILDIYTNERGIFTGHSDNSLMLWNENSDTGEMTEITSKKNPHQWSINCIVPFDGDNIYTASGDNTIKKWEVRKDEPLKKTLKGHLGSVIALATNKKNQLLASVSTDNTLRLWGEDGKEVCGAKGERYSMSDVTFSSDGRLLAVAEQNEISLWLLDDKKSLISVGRFEPYKGSDLAKIAFTSSENLLSANEKGVIKNWDIKIIIVRKYFQQEIDKRKAKQKYTNNQGKKIQLFADQGEYEPTSQYRIRKDVQKDFSLDLDREYKKAYDSLSFGRGTSPNAKIVQKNISLRITYISRYDADSQEFEVTIKDNEFTIKVPLKTAPEFKRNFKKIKVTGVEVKQGNKILEIKDIKIKDPYAKETYEIKSIIDYREDE